jgi:hypothetical protein
MITGRNCCCAGVDHNPTPRRPRRWLNAVGWLVPATALALMPKCPMCVVAYVAIFTGIGVTLPVATALRTTLILLCAASLAFMGARAIVRAAAG